MKNCTKCKTDYPATIEYFPADKQHKDGLASQCRECYKKRDKEYRQAGKGKAAIKKYRATEKGKATSKRYGKKYRSTINGHLHCVYRDIIARCNNPKNKRYPRYGGRDIKNLFNSVDEFVDYVVDILQVDPRGLQIDRIDNDGNYEPGNIRFVTCKENCLNRG